MNKISAVFVGLKPTSKPVFEYDKQYVSSFHDLLSLPPLNCLKQCDYTASNDVINTFFVSGNIMLNIVSVLNTNSSLHWRSLHTENGLSEAVPVRMSGYRIESIPRMLSMETTNRNCRSPPTAQNIRRRLERGAMPPRSPARTLFNRGIVAPLSCTIPAPKAASHPGPQQHYAQAFSSAGQTDIAGPGQRARIVQCATARPAPQPCPAPTHQRTLAARNCGPESALREMATGRGARGRKKGKGERKLATTHFSAGRRLISAGVR
jgi:hypothetical protein